MKGDVIYVKRLITEEERNLIKQQFPIGSLANYLKFYKHYGIDLGDGNVIHFSGKDILLSREDALIRMVSMGDFLKDAKKEIDTLVKYNYDRDLVVKRAVNQLDEDFGGYNALTNNCEHFTYWCATGRRSSRQVFFLKDDRVIIEKVVDKLMESNIKLWHKIKEIKKLTVKVG